MNRLKNRWKGPLALLVVIGLAACGDDRGVATVEPGAEPGYLTVTLTSPYDDDGAVSFVLRGEGIGAPTASSTDYHLFAVDAASGTDEVRVAVLGNALSGALVRFQVPDTRTLDAYSVELLEVSDERNRSRADLTAYTVRIVRQRDAGP